MKRLKQQLGTPARIVSTAKFSVATFSPQKMAQSTSSGKPDPSSCGHMFTKPLPEGANPRELVKEFMATVNMDAGEIAAFLNTDESRKAANLTEEFQEQQGRHLGRRVCELLEKVGEKKSLHDPHAYELSLLYEADLREMFQVTDYIRCHLKERNEKEKDPLWRFRLMNCEYDPLKEQKAPQRPEK